MAWITPKTDWLPPDGVGNGDFNRIEGNISFLGSNPVGTALRLAPGGGNILIGKDTDDGSQKLQVEGDSLVSGSIFFEGKYRTRYQTINFSSSSGSYVTYYTAPTSAIAFVTIEDGEGLGQYAGNSMYTLHNVPAGGTANDVNEVELFDYSAGPGQTITLKCKAVGNKLQFNFFFSVGVPVFDVNIVILERV